MNKDIKKMIYTSLMIAIVFISTVIIAIPIPLGGYINLGDAAIFISSFILGPIGGLISGALGSALGDYYLGYTLYIIPTLIIKGSMGYISGYFIRKNKTLLGLILSIIILVVGYYSAEIIMYNNFLSPLSSIPPNALQVTIGAIISIAIIKALKKYKINTLD